MAEVNQENNSDIIDDDNCNMFEINNFKKNQNESNIKESLINENKALTSREQSYPSPYQNRIDQPDLAEIKNTFKDFIEDHYLGSEYEKFVIIKCNRDLLNVINIKYDIEPVFKITNSGPISGIDVIEFGKQNMTLTIEQDDENKENYESNSILTNVSSVKSQSLIIHYKSICISKRTSNNVYDKVNSYLHIDGQGIAVFNKNTYENHRIGIDFTLTYKMMK